MHSERIHPPLLRRSGWIAWCQRWAAINKGPRWKASRTIKKLKILSWSFKKRSWFRSSVLACLSPLVSLTGMIWLRKSQTVLAKMPKWSRRNGISVEEILATILEKVDDPVPHSLAHEYLAALNAPVIYTTNWDNVIEGTYHRLSKPYNLVEKSSDFLNLRSWDPTIIKYHGSLSHPKTLVVTESDYYERFGTDSPFDIRLRSDLLEKSLLFLGYSLRDYNVRYLLNRVQKTLSAVVVDPPPSYFVAIHTDEVFETVLAKNNIVTINLDSAKEFLPFMKHLVHNVSDLRDARWQERPTIIIIQGRARRPCLVSLRRTWGCSNLRLPQQTSSKIPYSQT